MLTEPGLDVRADEHAPRVTTSGGGVGGVKESGRVSRCRCRSSAGECHRWRALVTGWVALATQRDARDRAPVGVTGRCQLSSISWNEHGVGGRSGPANSRREEWSVLRDVADIDGIAIGKRCTADLRRQRRTPKSRR